MLVGVLPATSPTLMPGDLTGRLRGPLGQPSKVQVKTGYKGFYYPGLAVEGLAAPLDLYLIPTTMGIVTAACVAAGDSGAPYYDCWKNLATLRLLDGLALRPGPDAAFRQRLPAEIATLDTVRDGARRELASRIPATQARGASRVAAAYERAAASLLPVVSHSSSWSRGVVAQLRAVGAAFRGVVDPLRSADAVRYARGRARAHARERRLERLIHDPESS
jgi:hypothetical protein